MQAAGLRLDNVDPKVDFPPVIHEWPFPIPPEIFDKVLSFLSIEDLKKLRLVNSQLKQFVEKDSSHTLRTLARDIVQIAVTLTNKMEDCAAKLTIIRDTALVQARWSDDSAIKTANKIPEDSDYTTRYETIVWVAYEQAKYDLPRAQNTLLQLKDVSEEVKILAETKAAKFPKINLRKLEDLSKKLTLIRYNLLIEIAEEEAKTDYTKARVRLDLAEREIMNGDDDAFEDIANIEMLYDTEKAFETAKKIHQAENRFIAISNIAVEASKVSLVQAIYLLSQILEDPTPKQHHKLWAYAVGLAEIANLKMVEDPHIANKLLDLAIDAARSINRPFWRTQSLNHIARILAKHNLPRALEFIQTIPIPEQGTVIGLEEISEVRAKCGDLAGAKRLIEQIEKPEVFSHSKSSAFVALATAHLKTDLGYTFTIIKKIITTKRPEGLIKLAGNIQSLFPNLEY